MTIALHRLLLSMVTRADVALLRLRLSLVRDPRRRKAMVTDCALRLLRRYQRHGGLGDSPALYGR